MGRRRPVHAGPGTDLGKFLEDYLPALSDRLSVVAEEECTAEAAPIEGGVAVTVRRDGAELPVLQRLYVGEHVMPSIRSGERMEGFGIVMAPTPEAFARSLAEIVEAHRAHGSRVVLDAAPTHRWESEAETRRMPPGRAAAFAPVVEAVLAQFARSGVDVEAAETRLRRDPGSGDFRAEAVFRLRGGGYSNLAACLLATPSIVVETEFPGLPGRPWKETGNDAATASANTVMHLLRREVVKLPGDGPEAPSPAP